MLAMLHSRQDLAFRCSLPFQLISDTHTRNVLHPFEQLAEKSLRGLLIAPALHKDVEHIAVLVHCSPHVMSLATESEEDLVHVPVVATMRATTTEFIGLRLPELQAPLSNGFIAHDHSSWRQKLLHIAKTEREAKIQPNSVTHNFRREAETFVGGGNGVCFHEGILT